MSEIEKSLAVVREAILKARFRLVALDQEGPTTDALTSALSALSDVERAVGEMESQRDVLQRSNDRLRNKLDAFDY